MIKNNFINLYKPIKHHGIVPSPFYLFSLSGIFIAES